MKKIRQKKPELKLEKYRQEPSSLTNFFKLLKLNKIVNIENISEKHIKIKKNVKKYFKFEKMKRKALKLEKIDGNTKNFLKIFKIVGFTRHQGLRYFFYPNIFDPFQ